MIPLKQKLAGNELFNFAAFLRDEWRTNDWMWGRLDAVSTLVGLLVTPQTIGHWLRTHADPLDALHRSRHQRLRGPDRERLAGVARPQRLGRLRTSRSHMEIAALQAGEDAPRLDAIRGALTARRQWEILADELGRSSERGQVGSGPARPMNASAEVGTYAVGMETLAKPPRENTIEAFRGISEALARSITWHAESYAGPPPTARRAKRNKPPLLKAARWTSTAVRFGGPIAATILFSERGASSLLKRISLTVMLAVVALGLLLWAVLESWVAVVLFIAALVIGAVAVVRIGRAREDARCGGGSRPSLGTCEARARRDERRWARHCTPARGLGTGW